MEKAESMLQRLGLPPEFGVTLLIVCLALSVAPYFSGADFGILKIPSFRSTIRRNLRFGGPIALVVAIFLHIPFIWNQPSLDLDRSDRSPRLVTPAKSPPPPAPRPPKPDLNPPPGPDMNKEKPAPLSPLGAGSYRVHLMIPTSMSDAAVWLDGREARILRRAATLITIEVPVGSSNHQIMVEREGSPTCVTTVVVTESDTTLTPCQD